jgi:uncharacterized protein (TIGR02996 family)
MPDESAFVAAVRDAPDEEGPRLVYADWLDEHGDPESAARAEFIRLQCALARLPPRHPGRPGLWRRERAIQSKYGMRWGAPLRKWGVLAWGYRLGMVEEVTVAARSLARHIDELFAVAPVRRLKLVQAAGVGGLTHRPQLAGLEALDVSNNWLGDGEAATLLAVPEWERLAGLDLSGNRLGRSTLVVLATSPHLAGLERLDLRGNFLRAEHCAEELDAVLARFGDGVAV